MAQLKARPKEAAPGAGAADAADAPPARPLADVCDVDSARGVAAFWRFVADNVGPYDGVGAAAAEPSAGADASAARDGGGADGAAAALSRVSLG